MELTDKLKTLTELGVTIILDDSLAYISSWATGSSAAYSYPTPAPKKPSPILKLGTIWHSNYIDHVIDYKIEEVQNYNKYNKQMRVNSETVNIIENYLKTIEN